MQCDVQRRQAQCTFAGDQLGDADAEVVVQHEHFAAGDQPAVDVDVDRVAGQLVERDDGALLELQHVFELHVRAAELDLEVELHVAQQVERGGVGRGGPAAEAAELERLHAGRQLGGGSSTEASACWALLSRPSALLAAALAGGGLGLAAAAAAGRPADC